MKKEINANSKLNWSFWLSIFAIVISSITMLFFFWKVEPNSVVDASTFIGIIAAFIGISVTLVIGFQIYSFISIKDKINEMASLKSELTTTEIELQKAKSDLSNLENELKGRLSFLESYSDFEKNKFCDAFQHMQYAMIYFCDLDSQKESLNSYVEFLNECLSKVKREEFGISEGNIMFDIDISMALIRHNNFKIKERKYYWVIKDKYNKVYSDLLKKLESFKSNE